MDCRDCYIIRELTYPPDENFLKLLNIQTLKLVYEKKTLFAIAALHLH